jgi:hypothetical protein
MILSLHPGVSQPDLKPRLHPLHDEPPLRNPPLTSLMFGSYSEPGMGSPSETAGTTFCASRVVAVSTLTAVDKRKVRRDFIGRVSLRGARPNGALTPNESERMSAAESFGQADSSMPADPSLGGADSPFAVMCEGLCLNCRELASWRNDSGC